MKTKPALVAPERIEDYRPGVCSSLMFLGASFKAERGDKEPADRNWSADHWRCSLSSPFGRFSSDYWMGIGHGGRAPDLWGFLDSCQSDASLAEGHDFEDFCSEMGHDLDEPESRRAATRSYKACQKMSERMAALLGPFAVFAGREDYAQICETAMDLCQERPEFFDLSPKRGNGWGLLELAAFCAEPHALAVALSREPGKERLAAALAILESSPQADEPEAGDCKGALESFLARDELRESVGQGRLERAPSKGI